MLTTDNVTIGIGWRFGPNWLGTGAVQRHVEAPRVSVLPTKNGRYCLDGGASTVAKTEANRVRIWAANLRHGKLTKDKLEKWRENDTKGLRYIRSFDRWSVELIANSLLDTDWRVASCHGRLNSI